MFCYSWMPGDCVFAKYGEIIAKKFPNTCIPEHLLVTAFGPRMILILFLKSWQILA